MIAYIPILVLLIGLVVYVTAKDKVAECGRLAFFAGLLATMMQMAGKMLRIG